MAACKSDPKIRHERKHSISGDDIDTDIDCVDDAFRRLASDYSSDCVRVIIIDGLYTCPLMPETIALMPPWLKIFATSRSKINESLCDPSVVHQMDLVNSTGHQLAMQKFVVSHRHRLPRHRLHIYRRPSRPQLDEVETNTFANRLDYVTGGSFVYVQHIIQGLEHGVLQHEEGWPGDLESFYKFMFEHYWPLCADGTPGTSYLAARRILETLHGSPDMTGGCTKEETNKALKNLKLFIDEFVQMGVGPLGWTQFGYVNEWFEAWLHSSGNPYRITPILLDTKAASMDAHVAI